MKKKFGYLIVLLFISLFVLIFIRKYNLKHNFELSNAIITSAGKMANKNGNWLVEYQYKTKQGQLIQSDDYLPLIIAEKNSLIGKTIPVAYYRNNNKVNELLIYKRTWEQHNLVFPDSLNWIRKYIDVSKIIYSY